MRRRQVPRPRGQSKLHEVGGALHPQENTGKPGRSTARNAPEGQRGRAALREPSATTPALLWRSNQVPRGRSDTTKVCRKPTINMPVALPAVRRGGRRKGVCKLCLDKSPGCCKAKQLRRLPRRWNVQRKSPRRSSRQCARQGDAARECRQRSSTGRGGCRSSRSPRWHPRRRSAASAVARSKPNSTASGATSVIYGQQPGIGHSTYRARHHPETRKLTLPCAPLCCGGAPASHGVDNRQWKCALRGPIKLWQYLF